MSVLKSKRNVSSVQFLDTARELEIYTVQRVRKFPKSWTFYFSVPVFHLAQAVLNNAKAANSIYPRDAKDARLRRDYLMAANVAVQQMISQLSIAKDAIEGIPDNVWEKWSELLESEAKLIPAVLNRDLERFGDLV